MGCVINFKEVVKRRSNYLIVEDYILIGDINSVVEIFVYVQLGVS